MSPDVRREMPRIEQLKHLDDVRITCVRAALDGYGFEWVGEAEIREMLDQLERLQNGPRTSEVFNDAVPVRNVTVASRYGRDVTEVARLAASGRGAAQREHQAREHAAGHVRICRMLHTVLMVRVTRPNATNITDHDP